MLTRALLGGALCLAVHFAWLCDLLGCALCSLDFALLAFGFKNCFFEVYEVYYE